MKIRWLAILLVFLLGGCARDRVDGVSLSLGSFERGLWHDHDKREYQPKGWGIKLDWVCGNMVRPIPKIGKDVNVWEEPAFVIRSPMTGPFLSIHLGEYGIYLGMKTFELDHGDVTNGGRYDDWVTDLEKPAEGEKHVYLCPSATMRRTRWK